VQWGQMRFGLSSRLHGETYAAQLVLGVEEGQMVVFDRISTLLKGSAITDDIQSDIVLAGNKFTDEIIQSLTSMGIIDSSGGLTTLGKTLKNQDQILKVLEDIKFLKGEVNKITLATSQSKTNAAVSYRENLLRRFGLAEEKQFGGLLEEADKMEEMFKNALKQAAQREKTAIVQFDTNVFGAITSGAKEEINAYVEDLSKSTVSVRDTDVKVADLLEKHYAKQQLLSDLDNTERILPYGMNEKQRCRT
jgi:hypothetical protein